MLTIQACADTEREKDVTVEAIGTQW